MGIRTVRKKFQSFQYCHNIYNKLFFFRSYTEMFLKKKFSHFGQNVSKYSLMNNVTASSDINCERMTEMSQRRKNPNYKYPNYLGTIARSPSAASDNHDGLPHEYRQAVYLKQGANWSLALSVCKQTSQRLLSSGVDV